MADIPVPGGRGKRSLGFLALTLALLVASREAEAQRLTFSKGEPVFAAYEGWEENPDGSFNLLFGYMNANWDQELQIPVGPDNHFSPGPADRGQPTYFLPRRNRFVFKVRVPPGFGDQELVWTVRANGREYSAYATLRQDYFVDNVVIMSETGALGAGTSSPEIRANEPPTIELEGDEERETMVGQPLTLAATVTDDGQPSRGRLRSSGRSDDADSDDSDDSDAADVPTPQELLERALRQATASSTVSKRVGLHFTWFVYRGPGDRVEFDPPQIKPWEDTRPFANSPWARAWVPPGLREPSELPGDGRWTTNVWFHAPGTYVLRGRADDGGLYSDVEVTVQVTRPSAG